ncbi:MAG: DNA repair protein RecN [Candidatus Dormibacteria bacterium]
MGLVELRINDLAVIREARMEPGPGFTVVTGETGAGKSVCISALRLALGGRVDGDLIRPGAGAARVAAVFDNVPAPLQVRLEELGIPSDDDLLTLSRDLPAGGRSTARVNGALVSQAALAEVGDGLAEVTSQGASQRLLQRAWQRRLLDAHGGPELTEARDEMARRLAGWREAEAALSMAMQAAESGADGVLRARECIERLQPLGLTEGEDTRLLMEAERLRHAAGISTAAESIRVAGGGGDDLTGAADLLAAAVDQARPLAGVDPALRALVETTSGLIHALRDLAADARACAEAVALDDTRLAAVEERLDTLARVRRRYGSLEAALSALAEAEEMLAGSESSGTDFGRLRERLEACRRDAVAAAEALGALRASAAERLQVAVERRLHLLELPHARFEIGLRSVPDPHGLDLGSGPVRCTAQGAEEVEFRLAANPEGDPRALDAGPSGGELSRLALALGSVVSTDQGSLLVLDEVDSGISGETAARVGDVLADMGHRRQVLAVTHRSEIAARAGAHLLAVKEEREAGTETRIHPLRDEARRREIARLMSGRNTRATLARAAELLLEGTRASTPFSAAS